MQVLHGDCKDILRTLPENSIDAVYTCPSPPNYYADNVSKRIGSEKNHIEYIENLTLLLEECRTVLKSEGSLFVQVPDQFSIYGNLIGIPTVFESVMVGRYKWWLNDRIIWHRTETHHDNRHKSYKERGFLKNYEIIFHFVKNMDNFYFNTNSKYIKTSVHSYPMEDSYYTNEFDSGLPSELSKIIIDTTVPPNGIVLDPFCGTGKVGVVAKKMNRDFIGIDIDFDTVNMCRIRLGI